LSQHGSGLLEINENDLKGACPRLNKQLAAMQAQISAVKAAAPAATFVPTPVHLSPPVTDAVQGASGLIVVGNIPEVTADGTLGDGPLTDAGTAITGTKALFLPPYAIYVQTGQTGSLSIANIQHAGAVLPAGQYEIVMDLETVAVGSTTVTITFGWTSPKIGAQTLALFAVNTGSLTVVQPIRTDGLANLTSTVVKTGAGTVSYDVVISVRRNQ
jgi:hypothetical protein